jgi:drug/metabolite transporter (DMT)-like permease
VYVAIAAALAAGACFAVAGLLQQRAASSRPGDGGVSVRLLLDLVRDRTWLAGIGMALLSYGFQSTALAFGPLSLVQPLIVTELMFAIPLSARIHRMRLGRREWIGALLTAGGLATAIAAAQPQPGHPVAALGGWLRILAVIGGVVATALLVSRFVDDIPKASLIALAGGAVMGTQSALLDATVHRLTRGISVVFTAWQTYLMVAASIGGLLLIQNAFQVGPLAASMPMIDATEPTVAITIGIVLFHEKIRIGPVATSATVLGLVLVFTGILMLDTSPLLKRLHRKEKQERPGDDGPGCGT